MTDEERECKFCYLLDEMQNDIAKNMRRFADNYDIEGVNYWPLMMGACINFLFRLLSEMDEMNGARNIEKIDAHRIDIVHGLGELFISTLNKGQHYAH